jgi:hypothetical protein
MVAIVGLMAIGLTGRSALGATLDLTTASSQYLGYINPSQPASISAEADYINTLIAQALNSGPTSIGGREYTRSGNDCGGGACPDAFAYGAVKVEADLSKGVPNPAFDNTSIDVTGYQYLLAKYDGPNWGSEVWYVGGITGTVSVPSTMSKYGISHYTLFNAPDGGATLMLLGGALVGFEALRRRIRA